MIPREEALRLIGESLEVVNAQLRPGVRRIELAESLTILGSHSPMDSLNFVVFLSDLEERLHRATGKDLPFNMEADASGSTPFDSVATLADYLVAYCGPASPGA